MASEKRIGLYYTISELCSVISAGIGIFALAGWVFDIPLMRSVLPGFVAIKANTAICFILSGAALWSLQTRRRDNRAYVIPGNIFALITSVVGALTVYEYLSGVNLGIDQLFFKEQFGAVLTPYLGRMAFITAANFFMLGIALLLLNAKSGLACRISQILAVIAGLITLGAVCGYIYGAQTFYGGIGAYTAMAVHTAVAFIFLCLGVLFINPAEGFSRIITSEESGGIMMRRLMLAVILVPVVLGWLKIRGESAGMYNERFGTALMVVFSVVLLSVIVWWTAGYINFTERRRVQAQTALEVANEEWNMTFNSMTDPAFIMDTGNNIINANTATMQLLGKSRDEVVGRKCYEIMHGTTSPIESCPLEVARRSGKAHIEEVNDPHIGIPILVTTSPIVNKEGRIVGFVHVAKDISAIKKVDDELRRKVEELERFQKISVDRELKMKELKDRIAQLEAMNSQNKET